MAFFLRYMLGSLLVRRIGRQATRVEDKGWLSLLGSTACLLAIRQPVALRKSPRRTIPMTWGILRPVILLPITADVWPTERRQVVLAHELAHVKRRDCLAQLIAQLARGLYWFNPLVWLAWRRLLNESERACDDLVLAQGSKASEYAEHLLSVASGIEADAFLSSAAIAMARPSQLQDRLLAILDEKRNRRRLTRLVLGIALAIVAGVVVPLSVLRAVEENHIDKDAGHKSYQERSQPSSSNGPQRAVAPVGKRINMAVIVARHVLLLDGKQIITWAELEKRIAALPDSSLAYPTFYITRGAMQGNRYGKAKDEIWRLHKEFKLKGHSEGSLLPQADFRYDQIKTAADLVPDSSLRVEGRVVDGKGKPVAGAEVVLVTPVDKSIAYKSYNIALVAGRLRNPLEDIVTHSDDLGQFSLYPPKDTEYYVVVLHPMAGFGLVAKKQFLQSGKVNVLQWATLTSRFAEQTGESETAALSTQIRKTDALPEVIFNQYWSELKKKSPTDVFRFTHVPPIFETTIYRVFPGDQGTSFSLPGATVSLLPGDVRSLELGPLSEKQREQLKWIRKQSEDRSKSLSAHSPSAATSGSDGDKKCELRVLGPDGTPIPNATVEVRGSSHLTAKQIKQGRFLKRGSYGAFAETDQNGRLLVELAEKPKRLSVSIQQPGFGPYWAEWDSTDHPEPIPSEFTAELDAAWTVGSVIVDADGVPIKGAKVNPGIKFKKRPGDFKDLWLGTSVETDAQGRWTFASVPASMGEVFVSINDPNYKPLRRSLPRSEFQVGQGQEPSVQIKLQQGLIVTGLVRDESGKPIAGARLETKFLNDLRRATTGPDGSYRLVGCEPGMARIVCSAAGKARDLQDVRIGPDMKPVDFVMKPGGKIRVLVLDNHGQPVPKTRIFFQRWRGPIQYFEFDGVNEYTNKDGVWQWDEAPLDEIKADICPPNGVQLLEQPLVAGHAEYVFRCLPPLVISGNVTDAVTGKPVKRFRVVPGIRSGKPNSPDLNWARGESFEAAQGHYQFRPDRGYLAHLVRIEADGYEVAVSRDIKSDEDDVQIDFKLKPAPDISATIMTPAGKPAAGAKIALGVAGSQINVKNGDVDDGGTYAARHDADEAGKFRFPAQGTSFQLVITHTTGFAYLKSADGPIPETIHLTPWARVEGTFREDHRPMPNVGITLNTSAVHSYGPDVPNIFTAYDVTTGAGGRFAFERVLPGDARIGRRIMLTVTDGATEVISSEMVPIRPLSGKATQVNLGGTGSRVTGKLAAAAGFQGNVLWNFALVSVQADVAQPKAPPIPADIDKDQVRRKAWWEHWKTTPEGTAWEHAYQAAQKMSESMPYFTATVAGDGSFHIDDMPAGKYVLSVRFSEHSAGHLANHRFSVPEIRGGGQPRQPIDLGLLMLQ